MPKRGYAQVRGFQVGKSKMAAVGDMDALDRGGFCRQCLPQSKTGEDALGSRGEHQPAIIVARLSLRLEGHRFNQADPVAKNEMYWD